jgi:hypothetical protein
LAELTEQGKVDPWDDPKAEKLVDASDYKMGEKLDAEMVVRKETYLAESKDDLMVV